MQQPREVSGKQELGKNQSYDTDFTALTTDSV